MEIRILLVEDEDIVLEGMKMLIESCDLGFEVYTASDGNSALETAKAVQPGIILTDIEMPIKDGLTFIQELKEVNGDAQVIIISGYEKFEYARKAIELGVVEYILKPLDEHSFIDLLKKNKEVIEARHSSLLKESLNTDLIRRKLLSDLLRYDAKPMVQHKLDQLHELLPYREYVLASMHIRDYDLISAAKGTTQYNNLFLFLEDIFEREVKKYALQALFTENTPGEYVFIIENGHPGKGMSTMLLIRQIVASLEDELGISVTAGVSPVHFEITHAAKAYEESLMAIFEADSIKSSKIYVCRRTTTDRGRTTETIPAYPGVEGSLEAALSAALDRNNFHYCKVRINEAFDAISSGKQSLETACELSNRMYVFLEKYLFQIGGSIEEALSNHTYTYKTFLSCKNLSELKACLDRVLDCYGTYIPTLREDRANHIIYQVKQNIREDIGRVTLQSVSDKAGITPIYLSILFKKKTGENFKEYLTRTKISAAKEMLTNPSVIIYEVAEKLGYTDHKHFSRVFKKYTGYMPQEFRSFLQSREEH